MTVEIDEEEAQQISDALHRIQHMALEQLNRYEAGNIRYRMGWARLAYEAQALHAMHLRDYPNI